MPNQLLRYGVLLTGLAALAGGQTDNTRFEMANLRQDVALLNQRVGELTMAVEQLSRDNNALQAKAGQSYATIEQLNRAVADINRTMQAALADQKREVLQQVAGQIERLGKQTNAALDALAKNQATRPVVQTSFSDDFPKEGINYTVVSGDTLSGIAKKTGAKLADIRNANKIADDTKIRVGQTLFIPQGK
ncbi:MAG: LysM peptidoglycan-binding domain-containing protein [Opitutae bacterium]|nr:LysM peptidoglycan-binding domain-containing protein [Opitutae bacterium]